MCNGWLEFWRCATSSHFALDAAFQIPSNLSEHIPYNATITTYACAHEHSEEVMENDRIDETICRSVKFSYVAL